MLSREGLLRLATAAEATLRVEHPPVAPAAPAPTLGGQPQRKRPLSALGPDESVGAVTELRQASTQAHTAAVSSLLLGAPSSRLLHPLLAPYLTSPPPLNILLASAEQLMFAAVSGSEAAQVELRLRLATAAAEVRRRRIARHVSQTSADTL